MAAKGSKRGGRSGGYASTEDALAVGVARTVDWMRGHQRAVILGVLVAVALAAGLIYYRDYRKNLTTRAATQLEQLEAELAQSNAPASAVGRLRDFLNRFGGTPSADDARLLMARIQLDQGAAADAVKTLDPLSGRRVRGGRRPGQCHRDPGRRGPERALPLPAERRFGGARRSARAGGSLRLGCVHLPAPGAGLGRLARGDRRVRDAAWGSAGAQDGGSAASRGSSGRHDGAGHDAPARRGWPDGVTRTAGRSRGLGGRAPRLDVQRRVGRLLIRRPIVTAPGEPAGS
jgi:hypothetical protein